MSDPEPREPLDYRDWHEDAARERKNFAAQLVGGGILSIGVVFGLVLVWVLNNIHFGGPPSPGAPPPPLVWQGPTALSAIGLGGLVGIGIVAHRKRAKGLVAGLIGGFCLAVLIEGICFKS
jgi:hypothetical protein